MTESQDKTINELDQHDGTESNGQTTEAMAAEEILSTPKRGTLAIIEEKVEALFHDKNGEPYLTIAGGSDKPSLTAPVHSKTCAMLIREAYYRMEGKGIDSRKLEEIQNTLAATAIFDGEREDVFIRVAPLKDGGVEIDLGNGTGNCVYVSPDKYSVRLPSSRFVRPEGFGTIPLDTKAGFSFEKLWDHVNVTDDIDRVLIASWLVTTLRGEGPYPILTIQGEQGSAKSTTTRMLRSLVDPGRGDNRSLPNKEQDLFIAAQGAHVLPFDNLSGMSHRMSDAFCRLATGGTYATRKLYTNGEEVVHEACNPVIFNGIDDIITKPDLHSRAISIHLPRIPKSKRRDEATIWKEFEEDRPAIFNGLLRALRVALRNVDGVELTRTPRMADFAKFATAAEEGFGFTEGAVIKGIMQRQEEARLHNLDVDPVAPVVIRWLESDGDQPAPKSIEGTPTEVWELLTPLTDKPSNWPKTASHFSQHLSRIAPDLRSVGVIVSRPPRSSGKKAIIIQKSESMS